MIKYLTHKMKNQSISEDNNILQGKIDERDSGTESDGDLDHENKFDIDFERCKDLDMSSKLLTISPTNTTSTNMLAQHNQDTTATTAHHHLMYDQHSSEEELEVINGSSSSLSVPTAATLKSILSVRGTNDSVASETSSVEPEMFGDSPKRASSTQSETRKRSLPHHSDEEVRNLLDLMPTPVNFRSSPPLEAIRKIDFRVYRLNPMALIETSKGIENIKISCDNSNNLTGDNYKLINEDDMKQIDCDISNNDTNNGENNDNNDIACGDTASFRLLGENNGSCSSNNGSGNHQQQAQQHNQYQNKFSTHFKNSSSSSSSSMSSVSLGDVRSVSPPAKVSRRPPRTHQRLHRPHRPCLDFDKMQQVR